MAGFSSPPRWQVLGHSSHCHHHDVLLLEHLLCWLSFQSYHPLVFFPSFIAAMLAEESHGEFWCLALPTGTSISHKKMKKVIGSWVWYSPSPPPPFSWHTLFNFNRFLSLGTHVESFRIGSYSCAWETSIYPVLKDNHGEVTRDDDAGPVVLREQSQLVGALGRHSRPCWGHVDPSVGGWACGEGESARQSIWDLASPWRKAKVLVTIPTIL